MPRVWNTFKAPDGRKYYYNTKTKRSTWQRPESFYDDEIQNGQKRAKTTSEIEPFYVIPLLNGWNLVICDTGAKFYYSSTTKESTWSLVDPQSSKLLASLDKDKLVTLIAIARGYGTSKSDQIYHEVIHEAEVLKETFLLDQTSQPAEDTAEGERCGSDGTSQGLVAAYSSSDDDEYEGGELEEIDAQDSENKHDEEDKDEEKEDYDYDVDAINNLDEIQQPKRNQQKSVLAKDVLFPLFERFDCDPYSAWSVQAKKIQDDPSFFLIAEDNLKEEAFEEWCEEKIKNERMESPPVADVDLETEASEDEDLDLEPLKFHYLAHIVSKSTLTPNTIFLDIKNDNKMEFKKYKIKKFVESKSSQEAFVSKLLFYYKKMTIDERKRVFHEALTDCQDVIKSNIHTNLGAVKKLLSNEIPDSSDAYEVETRLLKMENWTGISKNVPELAEDPKYYVLGIRDKMIELMNFIKDLI